MNNPKGRNEDWRRNQRRSHPSDGSWAPTVPSWEKKFCTVICRIPWKKIVEAQKVMIYYSNIIDWDDSAAKEAFESAKARFYAEINGFPCQLSALAPDAFIDEINWNSEIDPQLILELEQAKMPISDEESGNESQIWGVQSSGLDQLIPCSGWEYVGSPVKSGDPWEKFINQNKTVALEPSPSRAQPSLPRVSRNHENSAVKDLGQRDSAQIGQIFGDHRSDFDQPMPCSGWEDAESPAMNEDPWVKAIKDSKVQGLGRGFENQWNHENSAFPCSGWGDGDNNAGNCVNKDRKNRKFGRGFENPRNCENSAPKMMPGAQIWGYGWESAENDAGNYVGDLRGNEDPWERAVKDIKNRSFVQGFGNQWNYENRKVEDSYRWRRYRHRW